MIIARDDFDCVFSYQPRRAIQGGKQFLKFSLIRSAKIFGEDVLNVNQTEHFHFPIVSLSGLLNTTQIQLFWLAVERLRYRALRLRRRNVTDIWPVFEMI